MSEALFRLAHLDLAPDRLGEWLRRWGADGTLRRIEAGALGSRGRGASVVGVSNEARRRELARLGIDFVTLPVPDHERLGRLGVAPTGPWWLFLRGTVPEGPAVAVVGTRTCTAYGRTLARAYGRALAEAGWTVVSGLARGIDAAAHRGVVEAGGRGIAVVGCGLDVPYPRANVGLARDLVAAGGAVVSEYPPGTRPHPGRFPARNRILVELADAVVVVETGVRGGSMLTVAHALDLGVPVFAVPGDVDRSTSRGCNLLLRDGAHPVLDPDDLVAELSVLPLADR